MPLAADCNLESVAATACATFGTKTSHIKIFNTIHLPLILINPGKNLYFRYGFNYVGYKMQIYHKTIRKSRERADIKKEIDSGNNV